MKLGSQPTIVKDHRFTEWTRSVQRYVNRRAIDEGRVRFGNERVSKFPKLHTLSPDQEHVHNITIPQRLGGMRVMCEEWKEYTEKSPSVYLIY